MSHFPARYAGHCASCNAPFGRGEEVTYAGDVLIGLECCGDADEPPAERAETVPLSLVLPRGKTVRDRCDQCFQIPASSGACGCVL